MGNFWAFILLIGPLIFIHELGHLLAAKLVDVKAPRFSIGFGPPLLRFRMGETEYCLAPIPLGGYVTLLGQAPGERIAPGDADRALSAKPLWARIFVLAAGPAANLVLPLLIYFIYFLTLAPTSLPPAVIGTVVDGSAAEQAELRQGDRIVAIDGEDVRSWNDMGKRIELAPGQELRVQIERDGERIDRVVTPSVELERGPLGVTQVGRLGVVRRFYAPQVGVIDEASAAYVEGLRTGDVITSINGEPVRTIEELQRMLESTGDGLVRLTYLRAEPVAGPLGTYLFYESAHAQLLPRKGPDGRPSTGLRPGNTFVRAVDPGSPAERAGIRPGDQVLEVDGTPFSTWHYLINVLGARQQKPLVLTVQSLGERRPKTVEVTQEIRTWEDNTASKNEHKELWFGAHSYEKWTLAPPEPIRGRFTYAVSSAVEETGSNISMIWTALRQMLTFQRGLEDLSSVVGLYHAAGDAADQGPSRFITLMALLTINLGFVNLLPIPILDGGHLLFFTIEAIRRRPMGQRAREISSAVGLVVILLLLLIATRNDIMRIWF
ncbi:site-2 protease family protein [Paraliomyxa miuraensis]|uniref:site-2 protease family protein n=1 Tax=Paraliomyxa miuraensis TaxID=376150 RepID=UPI00225BC69B|nr:site-2 protease family protein [Paraliomyxa miuraensis]MCX4239343.1 site-2 protease family protein [Paraliomyxa miuraensis]